VNSFNCGRIEGQASCYKCDNTAREAASETLVDIGVIEDKAGIAAEFLQRRTSALFDIILPATLVGEVLDEHMMTVALTCESRRSFMVKHIVDLATDFNS
jgi:hypothetical protein